MATRQLSLFNNKYLINILLPKYFNDGSKVPKKVFSQTFNEILDLFGGYSIGQVINGAWKYNGKVYNDVNVNVNIVIDNIDELIINNLINNIKERFKQLSIYCTIQEIKTTL